MAKEHLTEERKKQLEEMFQELHRHNFYTVLNVKPDADRSAVRRAYFAMSKLCHPDNYAEKDLGPHLVYMEKIFQACSKAYDVLGNSKKRKRYDEYLEKKADTAQMAGSLSSEGGLHEAMANAGPTPAEPGRSAIDAGLPAVDASPPSHVTVPQSSSRTANGGETGGETPSIPPSRTPSSAPASIPPGTPPSVPPGLDPAQRARHDQLRRSWGQKAARKGLLKSLTGALSSDTAKKSRNLMEEARKARDGGQAVSALNALRTAISLDPENAEARVLLGEVMLEASGDLARRYFEQARSEMEFGDLATALLSIEKSLKLVPEDPEYTALGAEIIFNVDGDLHRAYRLIQISVQREPKKPKHHLLMGKILVKAGLPARAKTALESALHMDPKLDEAKRILGQV